MCLMILEEVFNKDSGFNLQDGTFYSLKIRRWFGGYNTGCGVRKFWVQIDKFLDISRICT